MTEHSEKIHVTIVLPVDIYGMGALVRRQSSSGAIYLQREDDLAYRPMPGEEWVPAGEHEFLSRTIHRVIHRGGRLEVWLGPVAIESPDRLIDPGVTLSDEDAAEVIEKVAYVHSVARKGWRLLQGWE